MGKTPEELYQEREKRVRDAVALRKPDRVPVVALLGSFPARHAGISFQEEMNDREKCFEAHYRANADYAPDLADPVLFFGPTLDALDFKQLLWAGHGLSTNGSYQFAEGEYMRAEEYDAFLYDPTDFMIRSYWPRVFGKLKFFESLPPLRSIVSYYMGAQTNFFPFGLPQMVEVFAALKTAGEETLKTLERMMAYGHRLAEAGFPLAFGCGTQAPFDTLGDFFRGTRGIMLDMYRRPEKILQACEKILPMMIEAAIGGAKATRNPRVLVPLHKGAEGLMSLEQFKRFYWPTLKALLVAMTEAGLCPMVMVEASYASRLDIIKDVPEGKIIYWFEDTDLKKAKQVLEGRVCIQGNVPMSVLVAGTPDDVRACCKSLIDTVGKDGGYIMCPATGSMDDARPENLRAMIEFTKEYGVY